jgi:hypothetical protein
MSETSGGTAVLSALHSINEAVLHLMKPVFARVESLPRLTVEPGIVDRDRWPAPKESVERWFGFFDGVLKEEKEFLVSVVGLLPDHKVKRPVAARPPAKAA